MEFSFVRPVLFALVLAFVVPACLVTNLEAQTAKLKPVEIPAQVNADRQAELYAKLERYLTGTKWTGNFVMEGKDKLLVERYEILSATKNEVGDLWNLVARIKYGDHDKTFHLPPIEIKFAGKTPVITIDRVFFPGFGTFDARVVIRQKKYAGTWKHDDVGGYLFGTIEKMTESESEEAKKRLKKTKGP
jgi:hypothetical protein